MIIQMENYSFELSLVDDNSYGDVNITITITSLDGLGDDISTDAFNRHNIITSETPSQCELDEEKTYGK